MNIASQVADMSYARRLKVGAIVVKDDRIISLGYNGMPAGWDNNCEIEESAADSKLILTTKPEVIHAERNAIDKLASSHESGKDAFMFITHSPCLECAKSIYTAKIAVVYYGTEYRSAAGIDFLRKCGVEVAQCLTLVKQ